MISQESAEEFDRVLGKYKDAAAITDSDLRAALSKAPSGVSATGKKMRSFVHIFVFAPFFALVRVRACVRVCACWARTRMPPSSPRICHPRWGSSHCT